MILPVSDAGDHLGDGQADFVRQRRAPGRLELFLHLGVGDRLIGRVDIGQAAHVARALHVVLAAQRVDAAAGHAHVAQQHLQVRQVHHVAHAHDVLGDAHRPDHGHRLVRRQDFGGLVELLHRDAGDLSDLVRRVLLRRRP